jgi:hypothetical protein
VRCAAVAGSAKARLDRVSAASARSGEHRTAAQIRSFSYPMSELGKSDSVNRGVTPIE